MLNKTITYTKDDVTVVWNPAKCIHSGACVKGMPEVFRPKEKPWVVLESADMELVKKQVALCPSGALSIRTHSSKEASADNVAIIQVASKGPLLVSAPVVVIEADGTETRHQKNIALCRCGASQNKPYCDGTHRKIQFND